jgi:hypothetical protein
MNGLVNGLVGAGLDQTLSQDIIGELKTAILAGENYSDLVTRLQAIKTTPTNAGLLAKHSQTYARDAINDFMGQRNKIIGDDLGLEWYMYVGSNLTTTREFCEHLTKKKYIHKSELPTILSGDIDGHQCKIYAKTKLPYGLIDGTNPQNFAIYRGGWNCGHQLIPVSAEVVPENIRKKFEKPDATVKSTPAPTPASTPPPAPVPAPATPANIDVPNKALKPVYNTNAEVVDTFKQINDNLPDSEKWFRRGFKDLEVEPTSDNGSTDMNGSIWLKSDRIKLVEDALAKIANSQSDAIDEKEADAMATFWHEITHNRNKKGYETPTQLQLRYLELANEFTARKTLPEFYSVLGAKDTPQKQFMNNRDSTGYNHWVNSYDSIIRETKLDADKVLSTVKKHLFEKSILTQLDGLKKGLINGGIKKLDGSKLKPSELDELVEKCLAPNIDIVQYMKNRGIIRK